MAAPTPANMDICDPKCKCPSGAYKDQAFLCDDPCAGQGDNCTFDCQNGCDCPPPFPTGAVQARLVGGNMSWGTSNFNCSIPGGWATLHPAAYFDSEGQLVQYQYTFRANWGCENPSLEYTECNAWGFYPTSARVTKTGTCGGGDWLLIAGRTFKYVNGQLDSQSLDGGLKLNTSCVDGANATFCANDKYPVGTVWTGTVEYRECDGQGNCGPLSVG